MNFYLKDKWWITSNNIAILFFAMFLNGILFFLPYLALFFQDILHDTTQVALLFSIQALATMLLEVPTGVIADIFGRRNTLIFANIFYILGIVALYLSQGFVSLAVFVVLLSVANGLGSWTDSAIIYDILKEEGHEKNFKKTIGTFYALWPIGASIWSILGGFLIKYGAGMVVLSTLIPVTIATVLLFFVWEPKYHEEEKENVFSCLGGSMKNIFSKKQLLLLLLGWFLVMTLGETLHALNPLFFDFKKIPLEYFGWISAAIALFSSLGHAFSHRISKMIWDKPALVIGFVFPALFTLLATYLNGFFCILIFVLPSFLFGVRNPIISDIINRSTPSKVRATTLSTFNLIGQLGLAIGAPILWFIANKYTIVEAYKIIALLYFIVPITYSFVQIKRDIHP